MRRSRVCCGAFAALMLALTAPGLAVASPPSGVQASDIAQFTVPLSMSGQPPVGTSVTLRRIDIDPGGSTGWHWHPGPVYAVVAEGALTRVFADCAEETSPAGSVIEEVVGPAARHNGVNRGDSPVVLYVAYLMPDGQQTSIEAEAPDDVRCAE